MTWKLVKRNKAVSAFTTVFAVVLVWGLVVYWLARRDVEKANNEAQARQTELVNRTRNAVPALVVAARQIANTSNIAGAREQVELALLYAPTDANAHLLKGQLLLGQKDWTAARVELEQYLQQKPNDADVKRLLNLCSGGTELDAAAQFAVAEVLGRQNVPGPAIPLLQEVAVERKRRELLLLPVYQKQVEVNWPGLGKRLSLAPNANFILDLSNSRQLTTLEPLRGMQLNSLHLGGCSQVRDLTPLKGMQLNSLNLGGCGQVRDLTPLKGMPLHDLNLAGCGQVSDLTPLQDMPLTSLVFYYCGQLQDLTPLRGMPLTTLSLDGCDQVRDLSPLQGMKLTRLNLHMCSQIRDLTPLKGMKLTWLDLGACVLVRNLTPLMGMNLQQIIFSPKHINEGMAVLRQMKSLTRINGMLHDEFWKRYDAGEFK